MDRQVKSDIKMLNNGLLPEGLNYGVKQNEVIDWEKVKYNSLYRDYTYYEKKFADGYDSIMGFDKIIETMAMNSMTPLEEINLRTEKNVDNNNNESKSTHIAEE
jgi:hypothetical protein